MEQARHRVEASGGSCCCRQAITMANSKLDQKASQEGWLQRFDMFD